MTYSLVDFCGDVRAILAESDNHDGRQRVRRQLEALLDDADFRAAYLGADEDGMTQIYEDPDFRFCVLAYKMAAAHSSPPHDHGDSWAVYGQALGHTDMTVWSQPDEGNRIEPKRTFRLEAGQADLFDVREIHSISYCHGAKFVRVTGVDMRALSRGARGARPSQERALSRGARGARPSQGSVEPRRVFDPETGEVHEVASVGTSRR